MSTTVQSFKIEILGTDGQIQELGKIETSLKNLSRFRNQYNKDVEDAKKAEEAYGKQLATLNKLLSEGKIDSKAYQEEVKAIAIEQKKATQILENEVTVRGKLAAEQKSLIESKGKLQKAIKEENAEIKTAAGSYRALQQELTRLDQQYKALSEAERKSEFGQQLKGDVAGLRAQLKAMDAELGSNQRSVGDYGIVWDKLRGQLGPVGAVLEGLVSKLTAASGPH